MYIKNVFQIRTSYENGAYNLKLACKIDIPVD